MQLQHGNYSSKKNNDHEYFEFLAQKQAYKNTTNERTSSEFNMMSNNQKTALTGKKEQQLFSRNSSRDQNSQKATFKVA